MHLNPTHPNPTPKTALILGATGGVGGATARALARHGWHIRALARDPAKARAHTAGGAEWDWIGGDAMDRQAVVTAAAGASLILHGVNPPGYRNWGGVVMPMLENTIAAARASDARIFFPGTIYNFGPDAGPVLREESPQHPLTRKGAIRVAMEARLEAAAADGVRALILRAGDYFGPHAANGWLTQIMLKPGRPVRYVVNPGRRGIGHSWAYLPDVAETFAALAGREADLDAFERFHFAGTWDAEGTEIVGAIKRATGKAALPVLPLPWGLLKLVAPFDETIREALEIKQHWRRPGRFDNARLCARLGAEPHTPLDQAIVTTLAALGMLPRARETLTSARSML
jgi:nucleoside-diphosphate-sugar epimerase